MKQFLIALVILVIIVLLYRKYKNPLPESMTRIYRGVGFLNTGDEIPVAAGVVNSGVIADYTHTYDEGGGFRESCDLCPNATVCPHCPQFTQARDWTSAGVVEQMGGIDPVDCQPPYGCKFANNDIRSECQSAVRPPKLRSGPPVGMFHKDGGFYDFLPPDTDCRSYNTKADQILYHDIMNLHLYSEPASDECEYFGINGYVYKEPCNMKEIMDEQAKIMARRSSSNRN